MTRTRRLLFVATATAIGMVLGAATMVVANNVAIIRSGSTIDRVKTATNTSPFNFTGTSMDVPGARLRLNLTAESTLVVARFAATIDCTGDPGRCHGAFDVLDNDNGDSLVTTMQGVAHMDSTFGSEGHESHVAEASIILGPGDYDFQVRMETFVLTTGSVTVDIPMWQFTVERIV